MQAEAPQARLIMACTSNVYNADAPRPGREDDAVAPKHPYPASKVAAEALLRASRLTWAVLRFGFVYGDKDGHLESLSGLARTYKMHPAAKLSLIHHRDIVAMIRMAHAGTFDPRTVNATDDAPQSIFEMCQIAGDAIASSKAPLTNPWSGQMTRAGPASRLHPCGADAASGGSGRHAVIPSWGSAPDPGNIYGFHEIRRAAPLLNSPRRKYLRGFGGSAPISLV